MMERQVGQLFVAGFAGTTPTPEILDLIQQRHIGGVILFTRNLRDTRQTFELTRALQDAARAAGHRYPLLIMIDQENGLVRRLGKGSTRFPGNMALGAVGSEELVYEIARATGAELRAQGVNMNLAPVVDVNNNPLNPVIGIRSFGEDPANVARLGAAAVRGYREAGVLATLKHFPGHGDTATDSHLSLPEVPFDLDRLERVELVPFRRGIEAGAEAVLTAHIHLPALMPDEAGPASLSRSIITGLLRERLGFDGAVITDCLEMDAVAATVGVARGAVMAIQAGSDLVLVSHRADRQYAALDAARKALAGGELDAQQVQQAIERVMRLKQRYLSWETLPKEEELIIVGSAAHRELGERTFSLATTLVRDDAGTLPLKLNADARILIVARPLSDITKASDVAYGHEQLVQTIRRHHEHVESRMLTADSSAQDEQYVMEAARSADVVLVVTLNAHRDPDQARMLRQVAVAARRIVGLAVYDPYDAETLPEIPTFLATYDYGQQALEAAARALFGESPLAGRLPVTVAAAVSTADQAMAHQPHAKTP